MSWKDMDEKGVLRRGCFLIFFAALMVLAVLRFEQVWGALATLLNTLAPVFGGMAVAYVLNVFVHFFEDIAFKPFAKSKSKLWAQAKRPVAVALAYIVVLLVGLFVCFFIIPGLAESVSGLAVYIQQNAPAIVNQAVAWANAFARENDLTFVTEFLAGFNWTSLLSDVTQFTSNLLSSLFNVTVNPVFCHRRTFFYGQQSMLPVHIPPAKRYHLSAPHACMKQ